MRAQPDAKTAILALGAPAYLAASASEKATAAGVPTDVYVVNGFPLDDGFLAGLASRYTRVADDRGWLDRHARRPACRALPASRPRRWRAPASRCITSASSIRSIAPSETFVEVWEHFGISEKHLLDVLLEKP